MTKTFKHIALCLMALVAFAGLAACSADGDDIEKVSLSVTAGESNGTSLGFSFETFMCADVAWKVTPSSEQQPSAAEVLAQGQKEEANTTVEATATGLKPQTDYTITVAAKGHYGRVISRTVKMTTTERSVISLSNVFDASYTDKDSKGLYSLILTSGDTDEYGTPTEVGGITVSLDLYAALDGDAMNPTLPDGDYVPGSKSEGTYQTPGTFDPAYTYVEVRVENGSSTDATQTLPISDGKVTVSHDGDTYTVTLDATILDGTPLLAQYTGNIAFTYNASTEYKPFEEDQNVTFEHEQGRYWGNWFLPHADDFALQLFTGSFDENGKQTDGYYMYIPAYMPKLADYNVTNPMPAEGTYVITPTKSSQYSWCPYEVEQGKMSSIFESQYYSGIYLTRIDATTGKRYIALLQSGSMKVEKHGNGQTITIDGQTAEGIKVHAVYDGTVALTNYCDNDTNPNTSKRPWSALDSDVSLNFNSTTEVSAFFMGEDLKSGLNSWIVMIAADPLKDDYITMELLTPVADGAKLSTHDYPLNESLAGYTALPGHMRYGGGDVLYSWYGDMNNVDSEGYCTRLAPLNSGTITVRQNAEVSTGGESNYTFTFNTKDDNNHSITGSFTGKTTFYDATKTEAKQKVMRKNSRRMAPRRLMQHRK